MVGQYLAHHIFIFGDTMVCISCGKQLNNDTSGAVCQECIDGFAELRHNIENSDDAKFMKTGGKFVTRNRYMR